jgi:hypothetical protein
MTYRIADYADLLHHTTYVQALRLRPNYHIRSNALRVSVLHTEYGVLRTTFLVFSLFAEARDNYADAIHHQTKKVKSRSCPRSLQTAGGNGSCSLVMRNVAALTATHYKNLTNQKCLATPSQRLFWHALTLLRN